MKKFTLLLASLLLAGGALASTLPFEETFETNSLGSIDGVNGWAVTGSGTAVVQTASAPVGGSQALAITEATAANSFTGADTNVWITFWADANPSAEPLSIAADASAVFYVSTNGNKLVAYDGINPTELSATISSGWKKYEVFCDYTAQEWSLKLNGTPVLSGFAFHAAPASFTGVEFAEQGTNTMFLDTIDITDTTSFSAAPMNISLSADVNVTVTNSEIVITNSSSTELTCTFSGAPSWLTVPSPLIVAPGTASNLMVTANHNAQGNFSGTFTASYDQTIPFVGNAAFEIFSVEFNVGASVTPLTPAPGDIVEVPGHDGQAPGKFEPGDWLNITITSINNGAITVNGITNSLSSRPGWNITPPSATYASMTTGQVETTIYTVEIASNATPGTYYFDITNAATLGSWTNVFSIEVEAPNLEVLPLGPPVITHVSGGTIADKWEPGETVDITITSTNSGDLIASNITNTLTFPAGWGGPSSDTYPSMAVGNSTSTTYTVTISGDANHGPHTFAVQNAADTYVWPTNFTLDVYSVSDPSLITNALTIIVAEGETGSGSLILTNAGNKSSTFRVEGGLPFETRYNVVIEPLGQENDWVNLGPYADLGDTYGIPNWNGDSSVPMPIGFSFPVFGTDYTTFSVGTHGAIAFGGASVAENPNGTFPFGNSPVVAPFWSSLNTETTHVRYSTSHPQKAPLVISWEGPELNGVDQNGGGTDLLFQTWLFEDGRIRFLYKTMNGPLLDAGIGVQNGADSQEITGNPIGGNSGWMIPTNTPWVFVSPPDGLVGGLSSQKITYTANAANQRVGDTVFTNTVVWEDGSRDEIVITVKVEAANPVLIVTPNPLSFEGPAGWLSRSNLTLINTGNVALDYTVLDTGGGGITYEALFDDFSWDDSMLDAFSGEFTVNENSDLDEGYTGLFPIGFEFPFYGNTFTHISVGINGGISLGEASLMTTDYIYSDGATWNKEWFSVTNTLSTPAPAPSGRPDQSPALIGIPDHFIAPYWRDLVYDNDSAIYYSGDGNKMVITWENMAQGSEPNQTFQAILYSDGTIRFQYFSLSGTTTWVNAEIGLRDTSDRTTPATLVYEGVGDFDGTVSRTLTYETVTNWYGDIAVVETTKTNVVLTYDNPLEGEAVEFDRRGRKVITVDPMSGSLAVGKTNVVTVWGDASSLTGGGTNDLPVSTEFTVSSRAPDVEVPVTFTALGAREESYADADFDGLSDVAEILAGTDEHDEDSIFDVGVVQNPNGTRTLSWPAPIAPLPNGQTRSYTVFFTTNLLNAWTPILPALPEGTTRYTDSDPDRANAPVIYYKVTVE